MSDLKRQLGLFEVFSIAAGAMISSGLFVLPALAFAMAGPAVIAAYAIAALLILPSALSKAELATAMPRAGGTYFFVERSLGPVLGLFTGFANWFSLALKSAFAIVGMAALIETLVFGSVGAVGIKLIAVLCCLLFTALNIASVKSTGRFQGMLVGVLLLILVVFVILGTPRIDISSYRGFTGAGWRSIMATAGLVFISYGGLTKIAGVAEEIKRPGRTIVLGMLLAWSLVSLLYVLAVGVTVGVTPADGLRESLTPLALAASKVLPRAGYAAMAVAAFAAFVTTANGGILTSSRSPMSMSRDRLLPRALARVSRRFGTPYVSILITVAFMILAIALLDIEVLVKTASTMMIMLFVLDNVSVIVMRESRIQSYRPTFRSPLYPYVHVISILIYVGLLVDMGAVPLLISGSFVIFSAGWYFFYSRRHVHRASALMHIVERITDRQLKTVTLENELRDILLERDDVVEDRFDELIRGCIVLDLDTRMTHEELFRRVASTLSNQLEEDEAGLFRKLVARENDTGTVVRPGLAIPHVIVEGEGKFDVILVRAREGVLFPGADQVVKTVFCLAGSRDQRNYHLRALMAIAQIAQEKDFERRWLNARDAEALRNLVLLSNRRRDIPG